MTPPQPQPPAFTPKRTLRTATTYSELQTALARLQPGDRLPCKGVLFPSEAVFERRLPAPAELVFDATCKASGGKGLRLAAVWFKNVANLRFVTAGMVVSNPLGPGIAYSAADSCVFDGFDVRACGTDATNAFPTIGHIQGCYFRATVRDWALRPDLDDHPEKGTGQHGMNSGDSNRPYYFRNNVRVLVSPGSKMGGSLMEVGQPTTNAAYAPYGNKAWLQAANLLQDATAQTAGNALNAWGVAKGEEVLWIGATGLHGHAANVAGLSGGTPSTVVIRSGSAVNCCLNPRYKGQNPWQRKTGVTYGPGPFSPQPYTFV